MILFCGIPSEPPLALAIAAAEQRAMPHVVFNQRDSRGCPVILELDGGILDATIRVRGTTYASSDFTGIYSRLIHPSQLPEHRSTAAARVDPTGARRALGVYDVLTQWMQIAPCRVANRPRSMSSNASKPYQARLITRIGFRVPELLVTNSPSAVARFLREQGRLVYKSTSALRSIVRELRPELLSRLHQVRSVPTQFQAFVCGDDVRVHVVGLRVFATRIISGAVDYRYAARDGAEVTLEPVELPAEIAARCVRLSRALDLPFCGIDLKVTPAGEFYCFEVNPSPAYSYYEQATGQPVASALVDWLMGSVE